MERLLAALAVLTALAAAPVAAQSAPDAAARYAESVGRGTTALTSGDRNGALAAFRDAVQLEPSRPEAVCHLAATQRLAGDLSAAEEGFQACLRVARAANDSRWTARALHGVASTLERIPERMTDARTAWQEYVRFADGATTVASPAIGRARTTAIDQVVELERVMVDVRQRIAEREAARTATPTP